MRPRTAVSGLQIAFFIFALSIVCIPLSRIVLHQLGPGWEERQIFRFVVLCVAPLLILAFPKVRAAAAQLLGQRVPRERRLEVAIVSSANAFMPFAFAGLFALWTLWSEGAEGPSALLARQRPAELQLDWTFSRSGVFQFFAAVFAAPVLEELVFRGFLFRAWERSWGWRWSAVLTSATFAFYHLSFVTAFAESILFICVLRRTGSLTASVIVHSIHNLALCHPVLGQVMFPTGHGPLLQTWSIQFLCLAIAAIVFPAYIVMADRRPVCAEIANAGSRFQAATSAARSYD